MEFKLKAPFSPAGDQPKAIKHLVEGVEKGFKHQTLLGVTGSGKTFTMANLIAKLNRPTLVIAHNKTLAAQLCQEYRSFFPENAVEYFVSYYDYYQPEAYLPTTDTYIEKEVEINDEIDRLRHAATAALISRRDVIIVASVSCIYNLGSPAEYQRVILGIEKGRSFLRGEVLKQLVEMQFIRSHNVLRRGSFRLKGQTLEIMPAEREVIVRIEVAGDKITEILEINPVTLKIIKKPDSVFIFPAKHYVISPPNKEKAMQSIREELRQRLSYFRKEDKILETERLQRRTNYDLEMISEIGYCHGIENYSRHFDGRASGQPPMTLLDYFPASPAGGPEDFLLVIDESHVTIPQLHGMYEGDKARKNSLIEHGFRLPSAFDNRPLKFEEFKEKIKQVIYTSATPGPYEKTKSAQIVEQVIRPTGLVDPEVEVRPSSAKATVGKPSKSQIDDLITEIQKRVGNKERILITTLTKKMAEDLTEYLKEQGIKVKYLHFEVETLKRIETLRDLRLGKFDVLVGVNLLREGLDLPEVTLVAILDADKEGFLRSQTSLIQTIGRAARNVQGKVILYADEITGSMRKAISETNRRRKIQLEYNQKQGITPRTIVKKVEAIIEGLQLKVKDIVQLDLKAMEGEDVSGIIKQKENEMKEVAQKLEFELAAVLRDEIIQLKKIQKENRKLEF